MKKIILTAIAVFFWAAPVLAEQLVIELSSGNTIVVEYTGSIHMVTMQGESDTITGFHLGSTSEPVTGEKSGAVSGRESGQSPAVVPTSGPSSFKLKWADPRSED